MYFEVHKFLFEVMGILYPARLKALKVVLLQKRQIRPKKAVQRSRMMRHREVRGIREIIPIIHPEPVQQEVPTEQRVEALTEPDLTVRQTDIPEEHRREAERPEVQAKTSSGTTGTTGGTEGTTTGGGTTGDNTGEDFGNPLDRQKERNK